MEKFSIYEEITATIPSGMIGIEELIEIMTSKELKKLTDMVRASGDLQKAKRMLPNITVNGIFSQRGNEHLIEYGQLTAIDFDHVPTEELHSLRTFLSKDPGTHLMFISPSGNGLKVIIRHNNTNPDLHWNLYAQILRYYRDVLKIPYVDECAKDISRATYICHNFEPFYNPKSAVFQFKFDPSLTPPSQLSSPSSVRFSPVLEGNPMTAEMKKLNADFQRTWKDKALMDYIDRHKWSKYPEDYKPGNRNSSLIKKATELCLLGVDYELALWKLKFLYGRAGVPDADTEERVTYAYRNNWSEFGSLRSKWEERRDEGIRKWKNK